MTTDPIILGYLGRALSFELSALQHCMAVAGVLGMKGFTEEAEAVDRGISDGLAHAQRLTARMIGMGCAPNASQVKPYGVTGSVDEVLSETVKMGRDVAELYRNAAAYCAKCGDRENQQFFESLLTGRGRILNVYQGLVHRPVGERADA